MLEAAGNPKLKCNHTDPGYAPGSVHMEKVGQSSGADGFMSSRRMTPEIIAACLMAFLLAGASGSDITSQEKLCREFANPATSDGEAVQRCQELLKLKPTVSEIPYLAAAANSTKISSFRRRIAIASLLQRHVRQGMTISQVAKVLSKPTWLASNDVHKLDGETGGGYPDEIKFTIDQSRFGIGGFFGDRGMAVYVRIDSGDRTDAVTQGDLFRALQGGDSEMSRMKLTGIAFVPKAISSLFSNHPTTGGK